MDNLKYYNDSLAYDFEMFMPKPKVRREENENIIRLPKAKQKQEAKPAARTLSVSAFAVMISVIILAALCGNIFLKLQINEVNSKINNMKSQINAVDSEKTSLEMELEKRISYSNIELEATEMGMQKKDKSQVKYIRVNDSDTAVDKDGNTITVK
ncbi:MAG: hypothetical protein J6J13_00595 [Clostridia bacterium]|nr:hypothetical protein [Clostridia bacterium]